MYCEEWIVMLFKNYAHMFANSRSAYAAIVEFV